MNTGPSAIAESEQPAIPDGEHTWSRRIGRFFLHHPLNITGIVIVVLVVATAILGDTVAPYPPLLPSYGSILQSPTPAHPMGTDQIGRDVLSRVLSGARISMEVAAVVLLIGVS